MKKLLLAAALVLVAMPAIADSGIRRTPCGYQQIAVVTTAVSLTVPTVLCPGAAAPTLAIITAEAQAVRYRDDGTDPTAAIGQPLAVGVALEYAGTLTRIRFIEQTAGAKLNISYYK